MPDKLWFLRSTGLLLVVSLLCASSVWAQKEPSIGPGGALQFDYRAADLTAYQVTYFVAHWDNQAATNLGLPDAYLTPATTCGAVSYRVPSPFTAGQHQVVFRACNARGCSAGSAPYRFRGAKK